MSSFNLTPGVIATVPCPRCNAPPGVPCDTPPTGLLSVRDEDGKLLAWDHGCHLARFMVGRKADEPPRGHGAEAPP